MITTFITAQATRISGEPARAAQNKIVVIVTPYN